MDVVHRLEAVKIDDADCEGLLPLFRMRDTLVQQELKIATIRQIGQIVRVSQCRRGLTRYFRLPTLLVDLRPRLHHGREGRIVLTEYR